MFVYSTAAAGVSPEFSEEKQKLTHPWNSLSLVYASEYEIRNYILIKARATESEAEFPSERARSNRYRSNVRSLVYMKFNKVNEPEVILFNNNPSSGASAPVFPAKMKKKKKKKSLT